MSTEEDTHETPGPEAPKDVVVEPAPLAGEVAKYNQLLRDGLDEVPVGPPLETAADRAATEATNKAMAGPAVPAGPGAPVGRWDPNQAHAEIMAKLNAIGEGLFPQHKLVMTKLDVLEAKIDHLVLRSDEILGGVQTTYLECKPKATTPDATPPGPGETS